MLQRDQSKRAEVFGGFEIRKKPQRLLSILLAIVLTAGIFITAPLTAVAAGANDNPVLISGNCGVGEDSDVTFYCFKDGSMGIFGKGAIRDYELTADGMSTAPWYSDMLTLSNTLIMKKFAVERGVTRIGSYSFYFPKAALPPYITLFAQLYNIDIADTVTSIGEYAFYNQSMEEIMIPPSVTSIGYNAFGGMANLKKLTYFGDPTTLQWKTEEGDAEFPNGITCHVLKTYESQLTDINSRFAGKRITFVADMDNPYEHADNVDRNIAVYYGSANTNVLGGAAPYIIVGRFDKSKKSVTHGSNGFASCVKYNDKYYLLTDNATGALNEANINETTGKVEFKNKQTYDPTPISFLKLQITHQYVGSNTVKMIYTLTNTGSTVLNNIMVGGTGDIKIGADDFAAINPLMEGDKQVGFYMKSTKDFDKSESNEYLSVLCTRLRSRDV